LAGFAKTLRHWRTRNGLSLGDVAGATGISAAAISDWERGRRFPSGKRLEALARYFDVPLCALFCEEPWSCHCGIRVG
jgi:XRE family transcriptional regulator, fatty acid utilization regulator